MTVIGTLDLVAFSGVACALYGVITGRKEALCRDARQILVIFLVCLAFHYFSNAIEWLEISPGLDIYEDYLEILEPFLFMVFLYVILQNHTQAHLKSLASELSLAEERERRRIAAGIHDDMCQKLALIKFDLQSMQHAISEPRAIETTERVCQQLNQVIDDAHALTFDLANPVLYEVGLEAAIESWMARHLDHHPTLTWRFESRVAGWKPSEAVRVFLFRSVRELVLNVIKHARATEVKVIMDHPRAGWVRILVQDNGVGMDTNDLNVSHQGGFGLFHVKERLEYLGGRLEVDSAPNWGTYVRLIVPMSGH